MTNFTIGNNIESTVANNPLTAGGTTLNVSTGDGTNFPSTFPYRLTIWDEVSYPDPSDDPYTEIVHVTARTTDALTIVRAQESTSGVEHALGARVAMLITAGIFNDSTYGLIAAGALMKSEIPDQSFINLISNGDFESWSNGAALAPDGWQCIGAGGNIARNTDPVSGTYNAAITNAAAVEAYAEYFTLDKTYCSGRTITFGCWIKSSTASRAKVMILDNQGAGYASTSSAYHTGGGEYEWLTVTRTLRTGLTLLFTRIQIVAGDAITINVDGAIVVEGSVCPAFSPKPIEDDGIMLRANTPAAANDYGKLGQWCYDTGYIYVCVATDTWLRAAIATWE